MSDTVPLMKELLKPLIPIGGRIVLDLSDLCLLDSSGLGALVSLNASAIKQGYCTLELVNITPRVLDLPRVTSLTQLLRLNTNPMHVASCPDFISRASVLGFAPSSKTESTCKE